MSDLAGYIVAGIIAGMVTIYLIVAMLMPEKF